jgi:DNA-binding NtrC family response regulator
MTHAPPPSAAPLLLVADDEPDLIDIARLCFESAGWRVVSSETIADAKRAFAAEPVDAVLSDLVVADGSGLDLYDWARAQGSRPVAFYVVTGCLDERLSSARAQGIRGIFAKPCDWRDVVSTVAAGVAR